MERICLVPRMNGVGGMVSFQHKLAAGLESRGIQVGFDLEDGPYAAALIIGGTRQLAKLAAARRKGLRLVQRLDGMNWLHRVRGRSADGRPSHRVSVRYFLRAEYGNWLLALIRKRLAGHIVYQSDFSKNWWDRVYGLAKSGSTVIYNGVDLSSYHPGGGQSEQGGQGPPQDSWRVLLVEGSLMGGYEMGIETAVQLGTKLGQLLKLPENISYLRPVEIRIVGKVAPEVQLNWEVALENKAGVEIVPKIEWMGLVRREEIPALDRSAHLLYSSDLNAACPNSVIEALACGLPVAAFDTGALPELVQAGSGQIVPYGGNPWRLEPADVPKLAESALDILQNQAVYRQAARRRAESAFGLDAMVENYLKVLL